MSGLLATDGFQVGIVVALATSVVVYLLRHALPYGVIVGVPALVGTLAGFAVEHRWSWTLAIALVVLAVGAEVRRDGNLVVGIAAIVPGAIVLSLALPENVPNWGFLVAAPATVVAATLLAKVDRSVPRTFILLLAVTAIGVYGAVPDTEYARSMVGGLLGACVLCVMPRVRHRAGIAAALAGLTVWSSVAGGYPRPASVVGALGCVGVLAIAPLAIPHTMQSSLGLRRITVLVAVQCGLVFVCSRGAGLRASTIASAGIVVVAFLLTFALLRGRYSPRV